MSTAPVQVLVLGFDRPHVEPPALAELARLGEAGVVRLVDVLVVRRLDDGSLETVDGVLDGRGEIAAALFDGGDAAAADEGEDDGTWSLAAAVPAGGVAVVALIEHQWAASLTASLRSAGARLLEETWLSEADAAALASLESKGRAR